MFDDVFDLYGNDTGTQYLEDIIFDSAEAIRPSAARTVAQAAEEYRYINQPGSYVGRWQNSTTPYLVEPMEELTNRLYESVIFVGPAQCGKALALDTPIPTPTGWTTMGEIKVGDSVIGADGKPCAVTFVTETMFRSAYRITFANGETVIADGEHQWEVNVWRDPETKPKVMTTNQLVAARRQFTVPKISNLDLPDADLHVDPYVFGAWLGDGHAYGPRIYAAQEDADDIRAALGIETRAHIDGKGLVVIALSEARNNPGRAGGRKGVSYGLQQYGLGAGEPKHIPVDYLRASRTQRLALLQGLMDTDGHATVAGVCEFSSSQPKLAEDVLELLNSLGYAPRIRRKNDAVCVAFSPLGDERIFRLERKQQRLAGKKRRPERQWNKKITSIEPVGIAPVRCISVDGPRNLYAFGRTMLLTHNTDMFLNYLTYCVMCDPADLSLVQTVQGTARDFSIVRVDRLHQHTRCVGERCIVDNVFDKQYRNGMILRMQWPTPNELSGKPIPRLWLTDYDRMSMDIGGEGTPFVQAKARTTSFKKYGKVVAESSPGKPITDAQWSPRTPHEAPPCEGILSLYNAGDRRRFYWRCIRCQSAFEPSWELMRWPDTEDIAEAAEMAALYCPHCQMRYTHGEQADNPGKNGMNQLFANGGHARWIKEGQYWLPGETDLRGVPRRSKSASFYLYGMAAAFATWSGIVADVLNAEREYAETGHEETLKTVVNTKIGKAYLAKAQESMRIADNLKARAVEIGTRVVPHGVRFLIATVDVQKNRFEVQVTGIGQEDFWIVDRFAIRFSKRPDPDKEGQLKHIDPGAHPEDWRHLLYEVMQKTYPLADDPDRHMAIYQTACDSAGEVGFTANAYEFFRWLRLGYDESVGEEMRERYPWHSGFHSRFHLLKGASTPNFPRIKVDYPDSQRKDRFANARGEIPVLFINPNSLKNMVDAMLDRVDPGGRIVFPKWLPLSYYKELTVEVKQGGKWENPSGHRNESWDLLVYCIATLLHHNVAWEHIRWDEPPDFAREWHENSMVFSLTAGEATPFEQKDNDMFSELAKLGAEMAG